MKNSIKLFTLMTCVALFAGYTANAGGRAKTFTGPQSCEQVLGAASAMIHRSVYLVCMNKSGATINSFKCENVPTLPTDGSWTASKTCTLNKVESNPFCAVTCN